MDKILSESEPVEASIKEGFNQQEAALGVGLAGSAPAGREPTGSTAVPAAVDRVRDGFAPGRLAAKVDGRSYPSLRSKHAR